MFRFQTPELRSPLTLAAALLFLTPLTAFAEGRQESDQAAAASVVLEAVTGIPQIYELSDWEAKAGPLKLSESPMTEAMVDRGNLPPLAERIPAEPIVIVPAEGIGSYGGTMNFLTDGGSGWTDDWFLYEFPAVLTPDLDRIVPNTLTGWESSADAITWTLYLREGIRWSDGTPHTADDWVFYWNDIALNKDMSAGGRITFVEGTKAPGEMRKINDYTIQVTFDGPRGTFIEEMTFLRPTPYLPAHYLKRFHPDYTDMSEIEKEIEARGLETWTDLMNQEWKQERLSPERPFLSAWVPVNSFKDSIFTIRRNPYYFKVDAAGNQLPYIDQIAMESIHGGSEAFFLKSISGEIDWFIAGSFGGLESLPLAVQKGIENDFRIIETIPNCAISVGTTWFNLFHPDPVMREVLRNKDFRLGLSHSVNRDEVNERLFKGAGSVSNPTVVFGPPYYGERFARVGLEYDVDLANQLLDHAGLSSRDSDGFRLRPDGQRIRILLSIPNKWSLLATEAADLYQGYWEAIGVEVQPTVVEWSTFWSQIDNSEHDVAVSSNCMGGRIANPLFRPDFAAIQRWRFAPEWYRWISSGGIDGEEPPDSFKRYREIRDQAVQDPDEDKRIAAVHEMLEILYEELFVTFGTVIPPSLRDYQIATDRLRNVPNPQQATGILNIPAQFYLRM